MPSTVNSRLPDVSVTEQAAQSGKLDWVGMQGIDLPILLDEAGCIRMVHASADVQVNLPAPEVKGIHMSRLYQRLGDLGEDEALSPHRLHKLLRIMLESHRDCGSTDVRLCLQFKFLTKRPSLVSKGLSGWKAYSVRLDASLKHDEFSVRQSVTIPYSSTCPCSAALTRQLIEQGFQRDFADRDQVGVSDVTNWLREHATLATPHSQRSEAHITIDLPPNARHLGLLDLIDLVENALGTPVQTAVKREDEQAFAALNGQNLMFVEDAARRLQAVLDTTYLNAQVYVQHLESLHAHDAVAWGHSSEQVRLS